MIRSFSPLRTAALATSLAGAASLVLVSAGGLVPAAPTFQVSTTAYNGLCDASAAIALSASQFAVFNDEDNRLRFFTMGNGTPSAPDIDLDAFLGTGAGKESDIEGAARIGDVVYVITSHGRNSKGEVQERRLRFFALHVTSGGTPLMKTEGRPYRDLLETFIEPILKAEGFTAIPGGKPDPAKAPEMEGSLNIEGLAASGTSLLIGFRNPQPKLNGSARALVVELKNPAALITATPAAPEKGAIFKLDLGGRGIRSFEALPAGRGFAIVAGPFNDIGAFALYRWDGTQGSAPVLESGVDFSGFNPEALFLNPPAPGSPSKALSLTLLSDDGGRKIEGTQCKDLPKDRWRTRLGTVTLE